MKNNSIPWWMRLKVHFLIFGVTMSILPLFLLGNLGFTSVRHNLQKNIYEQDYEQVTVIANEIGDFIKNIENSLTLTKATSAHALIGKDETSRQIILEVLLQQESFIEEIKVTDENFNVIDQISRQEGIYPYASADKVQPPIFTEESSALSKVIFSMDGRPEIYLTTTVQDPLTMDRIGYLQAKVDLQGIINRYVKVRMGEGEYIFLVDQAGNLIGHTNSNLVFHEEFRQHPAVQSFLEGEEFSQGSEYKNIDGVSVIGAYASVGTPNWAVFIEQTAQEANKPILEFAFRLIVIAFLIMALVMILSIAFGLKVVHPIENLEEQVRRIISTGDLESHIPIESWDETGRLVKSFNQLLNSLDQKNENLKDEKALLTTVVDGVGAGMVLLNPDKQIIWWNTKFADWFGDHLENLPCAQVVKGDGMEGVYNEKGRNICSVFVNEERRHFRQMLYELPPDNPESAAYLLLLDDVTQEMEMEARMIETDKMAAIGLLASGVAHEINNPLAIIAAHSEDLLDRLNEEELGPTQEEIKNGFKIVLGQIVRCKQITGRLLGFARQRINGSNLIDIGVVSVQTLGLLEHKTKQKRIRIEHQMENSLFILGNENEWQQVVLNLINNALDASSEGKVIEVKGYREGEKIHFMVKDYGEGIPQSNLKKAFDPFFTTKSVGQGTGLGLYVSYGIVQKMQGEMTLESTEGEGTCVKITLSLHKG